MILINSSRIVVDQEKVQDWLSTQDSDTYSDNYTTLFLFLQLSRCSIKKRFNTSSLWSCTIQYISNKVHWTSPWSSTTLHFTFFLAPRPVLTWKPSKVFNLLSSLFQGVQGHQRVWGPQQQRLCGKLSLHEHTCEYKHGESLTVMFEGNLLLI